MVGKLSPMHHRSARSKHHLKFSRNNSRSPTARAVPETPQPQEPCYSPDLRTANGPRRRLRDTQARASRWQQASGTLRVNPCAAPDGAGSVASPVLGNLTSGSIINKKRSKESERTGTDNHVKTTPLKSFEMPAKNAAAGDSDRLDNDASEAKSPRVTKQNDDAEDATMQPLEASPEQLDNESQSKSSEEHDDEHIKLPQKRSKRSDDDCLSTHLRDQVVAPVRNEMGEIIMD